jgi:hypothetical protein
MKSTPHEMLILGRNGIDDMPAGRIAEPGQEWSASAKSDKLVGRTFLCVFRCLRKGYV